MSRTSLGKEWASQVSSPQSCQGQRAMQDRVGNCRRCQPQMLRTMSALQAYCILIGGSIRARTELSSVRIQNITPSKISRHLRTFYNFFRLSQPPQSTAMSTRYLSTIAFLTRRMTGTSTAPLAQHTQMVRNDLNLNILFY